MGVLGRQFDMLTVLSQLGEMNLPERHALNSRNCGHGEQRRQCNAPSGTLVIGNAVNWMRGPIIAAGMQWCAERQPRDHGRQVPFYQMVRPRWPQPEIVVFKELPCSTDGKAMSLLSCA